MGLGPHRPMRAHEEADRHGRDSRDRDDPLSARAGAGGAQALAAGPNAPHRPAHPRAPPGSRATGPRRCGRSGGATRGSRRSRRIATACSARSGRSGTRSRRSAPTSSSCGATISTRTSRTTSCPPFCVLAYDTLAFQPFKRLGKRPNIWGEPGDKTFTWPGHRQGRTPPGEPLCSRPASTCLRVPAAARRRRRPRVRQHAALPRPRPPGVPVSDPPVTVNCYGRDVVRNRGGGSRSRRRGRPARALAAPVLRARTGDGAHLPGQPLARGPDGLLELVARVPHREEPLPLSRPRGRPSAARAAPRGRLRQLARSFTRADGSLRASTRS